MEVFHALFLRRRLLGEIQIIVSRFGRMVFLTDTLLVVFCKEPLRQGIRVGLVLRVLCVGVQEFLQFFQNLFGFSAHFIIPPVSDLWMVFHVHIWNYIRYQGLAHQIYSRTRNAGS